MEIETEMEEPVSALFLADTHLLNSERGHWFDKLRREWQMYRAFQTALSVFQPDVVFILGDIFDSGICSDYEFEYYIKRLKSLFHVPDNVKFYVVAGNHDVGFHYDASPYIYDRFISELKAPSVQMISIRGNHFILINSMVMEGDGCFLCRSAQREINKIAKKLRCAKGIGKCQYVKGLSQYSRPIILQHFPMYRISDQYCSEPDEVPLEQKKQQFHERWDCLSKESSEMIYDSLNPRLIVGGHTHHGCHLIHRQDIHEYSVPSFNWRFRNNPGILLAKFLPNNYTVSKCQLPQETTIIFLYCLGCFFIVLWIILFSIPRNVHLYRLVEIV
ncbi:hypothetical protein RUM43_008872 [Polyplax serrata]|uniref:Calcineurin-like phosphoesterase domain-containing protein n=1 Tax=Polyplax serrata TaxID=468196 RepID=A0AAN8NNF1_POLSC